MTQSLVSWNPKPFLLYSSSCPWWKDGGWWRHPGYTDRAIGVLISFPGKREIFSCQYKFKLEHRCAKVCVMNKGRCWLMRSSDATCFAPRCSMHTSGNWVMCMWMVAAEGQEALFKPFLWLDFQSPFWDLNHFLILTVKIFTTWRQKERQLTNRLGADCCRRLIPVMVWYHNWSDLSRMGQFG